MERWNERSSGSWRSFSVKKQVNSVGTKIAAVRVWYGKKVRCEPVDKGLVSAK